MISFNIPKNYSTPDGVKEGAEFSDIATFKIKDGKIQILTIGEDNSPVGTSEKEKPKGGKEAIKEQLSEMENEGKMEEEEGGEEEESPEEEMD